MGRPSHSEEQYRLWLESMTAFLKNGATLNSAIEKADLLKHKDSIYRKWRLNDWFCEKIQHFQNELAELANEISARMIHAIHGKAVKDVSTLSAKEVRYIMWFALHHRSCEPFFVQRYERVKKVDRTDEEKSTEQLRNLLEGK